MQTEQKQTLYPLLEIEIEQHIGVENILSMIYDDFKVEYQIKKVDLEYQGNSNYGSILLYLKGKAEENDNIIYYLNRNKIHNSIKGYV